MADEPQYVHVACLANWKTRRNDARVENHWKNVERKQGGLNNYQRYQQHWNFIESEYSERPSNNGLDIMNPAFAFTTNLAKYITIKKIDLNKLYNNKSETTDG